MARATGGVQNVGIPVNRRWLILTMLVGLPGTPTCRLMPHARTVVVCCSWLSKHSRRKHANINAKPCLHKAGSLMIYFMTIVREPSFKTHHRPCPWTYLLQSILSTPLLQCWRCHGRMNVSKLCPWLYATHGQVKRLARYTFQHQ